MNAGPVQAAVGGPVAVVRLADEVGRNVVSRELDAGLRGALDRAVAHPASRVVLLAGLPDIFCAGGSRADLAGGPDAVPTPEWVRFIQAPMHCPLPVVAALRGHAIGGGLLLGMYADLPVLSERSVYTANFLRYGFLPCMGATWLLPHRLGPVLGAELLLTAGRYRGGELRARGVPLRVEPHDEVEAVARRLADRMAAAPRRTLALLKQALVAEWRCAARQAFERELPGHLETVRLPSVQAKVAAEYGD
jgi:polyketide biosynthesis enoyl-CoA hydratase PksI